MSNCDFQVAVLYNSEEHITRGESQDQISIQHTLISTQYLIEALNGLGYSTIKIAVRDSLEDLDRILLSLSPKYTFIFNNCDSFNGNNLAAVEVLRLVEQLDFKHTGASADSIELCIDKTRTKERLIQFGLPTPRYQVFDQPIGDLELNFPVIVKPSTEDASIGIDLESVICDEENLFSRVAYILDLYDEPVVVEEFVIGREFGVAIWGNETIEILPISEQDYSYIPDPLQCLLTYEAKWDPESPYYQNILSRCPAPLTPEEEQIVCQVAEDSFRLMSLNDLGRVDIRFDNNIPYIIDINELPDLSPKAGFWHSAKTAGHSYQEMVGRILEIALNREGWTE